MRKSNASTWVGSIAILGLLAAVSGVQAGLNTASISIHFGAEQPLSFGSFLAPEDTAGVVPSENWNNQATNTAARTGAIPNAHADGGAGSAQALFQAAAGVV
jgi:hypothetical protein